MKEMEKKAKSDMLRKLSDEMKEMMREGYDESDLGKKMMKVTVAADDEEGLKKGLSKAEEIMKGRMSGLTTDDSEETEEEESPEDEEMVEESAESEKELLLKKIAELEKKLQNKDL